MGMVSRTCANKSCCVPFKAREADVRRGWGRFCSKSCKAVVQEKKTHQHRFRTAARDHEGRVHPNDLPEVLYMSRDRDKFTRDDF